MNKAIINEEITWAYDALEKTEIAENGKIIKTYRGQISTFGAAVTMGSLLPAIAFFSEDAKSSVNRSKLMSAILYVLKQKDSSINAKSLFDYARQMKKSGDEGRCKEDILNAAIALKLAMNLYELEEN